MSEKEEYENERRDINAVLWLGEKLVPIALVAALLGIMLYFMAQVGT